MEENRRKQKKIEGEKKLFRRKQKKIEGNRRRKKVVQKKMEENRRKQKKKKSCLEENRMIYEGAWKEMEGLCKYFRTIFSYYWF